MLDKSVTLLTSHRSMKLCCEFAYTQVPNLKKHVKQHATYSSTSAGNPSQFTWHDQHLNIRECITFLVSQK